MLPVFGQKTRNPMAAVLRKAVVMAGRMTAPDDCPTSRRHRSRVVTSMSHYAALCRQGALGDGSGSRLAKVLGVALSEPKIPQSAGHGHLQAWEVPRARDAWDVPFHCPVNDDRGGSMHCNCLPLHLGFNTSIYVSRRVFRKLLLSENRKNFVSLHPPCPRCSTSCFAKGENKKSAIAALVDLSACSGTPGVTGTGKDAEAATSWPNRLLTAL